MHCTIYRARGRPYTYLYVREMFDLETLPQPLRERFDLDDVVMELELTPDRTLAQADVHQVMAQLEDTGYFLQMPPEEDPSGWLELTSGKS